MDNPGDLMHLCRLCLVKDQVNIPIFEEHGDIRQIFVKISSCLPVKVSKDDQLPKRICDGCSNKLDLLYEFCNTSANSEKKLLSWLEQAGLKDVDTISAVAQHTAKPLETQTQVKQEALEDIHAAVQQTDHLELTDEGVGAAVFEENAIDESDEPPPPKRARRTAAVKAQINITPDSDDDDDMDISEPMTKVEDESDDSDVDKDPSYVDVPGTSADDQPGPSGVGKDGVEAPPLVTIKQEITIDYDDVKPIMDSAQKAKRRAGRKGSKDPSWRMPETSKKNKKTTTREPKIKIKKEKKETPQKLSRNQKANMWTCKYCLDTFGSRKEMFEHRKDHMEEIKNNGEVPKYTYDEQHQIYICNNCSAECQDMEEIEKHVETHEEKFSCYICKEDLYGPMNYSSHVQKHRDDKLYPCPWCQYMAQKKEAMQVHINHLHLQLYDFQCGQCGKCFNDALSFKEHNNVHLNIKPFGCVVCSKHFYYSRYLFSHQTRTHTVRVYDPESKTQCNICQKIFARMDTLQKHFAAKHLKARTGPYEKKHLCDVCGQGFSRPDKLKIHYRKHTGEKPYSCVYCSKSFIKRDYLIMHERIHSGEKPYSCEICGKCFNQGAPLRIHIRSHTGERPYICPYCGSGCVSRGALNSHIKSCINTAQT